MEKTKEQKRKEVLERVRNMGIALHKEPELAVEFVQRMSSIQDVEKAEVLSIEVSDQVAVINILVTAGGESKKVEFGFMA